MRPCGLNDNHPAGSRPLFSQGDVAVGRINRKDVAKLLVDCLAAPAATGYVMMLPLKQNESSWCLRVLLALKSNSS